MYSDLRRLRTIANNAKLIDGLLILLLLLLLLFDIIPWPSLRLQQYPK